MATTLKFTRAALEAALKKHSTRVAVANAIGCSPSYVNKMLEWNKDLKGLVRWTDVKRDKNKIWGKY
jgi:hypothetical protein